MDASAIQIGVWMVSGGAVMVIVNQALKLTDRLKEKPAPSETYVTKEACKQSHAAIVDRVVRLEGEQTGLRAKLDQISRENEERASILHKRINDLERDIAQVPSQVIALIRNTKGL